MVKVTFTLDDETVAELRRAALRLGRPQSRVVREAIADYASRLDRLSEAERRRMLADFDRALAAIPRRPAADTEAELAEVRAARRRGGRRRDARPQAGRAR
jgi:predicted transcriptional regulator